MFKKILSTLFVTILIFSIAAIPALAAPYADIKIGYGKSIIYATDFDADDYEEKGATGATFVARPEMEDIGGPQTEANNIGWINAGEWVQYTVNVEVDGKYKFVASLASDSDSPGNVELYYDGNLIGASENSAKEGWQVYDDYEVGEIEMAAGTHVIKALFPKGNMNISEIIVTALFETPATEPEPAPAANEEIPEAEEGADTGAAEPESTTEAPKNDEGNMILWIAVAAGAVVVIIIIAVLVTKKKK